MSDHGAFLHLKAVQNRLNKLRGNKFQDKFVLDSCRPDLRKVIAKFGPALVKNKSNGA